MNGDLVQFGIESDRGDTHSNKLQLKLKTPVKKNEKEKLQGIYGNFDGRRNSQSKT